MNNDLEKSIGRIKSRDLMHRMIDEIGEEDMAFLVTKRYVDPGDGGQTNSYTSWKSLNLRTVSEFWYEITAFSETFKKEIF